jgi:hypothetical protein
MEASRRTRPWWFEIGRYLLRMAALALPFAVLFGTLFAHRWQEYLLVYKVALVFTVVVGLFIRANEAPTAGWPSSWATGAAQADDITVLVVRYG